jgi:hypothetical protein
MWAWAIGPIGLIGPIGRIGPIRVATAHVTAQYGRRSSFTIVTHNVKDFGGAETFGIRVVTPAQLVQELRG